MKMTFTCDNGPGEAKIVYEVEGSYLPKVLENFELFLKGSGFVFNGCLEFVNDEFNQYNVDNNPYAYENVMCDFVDENYPLEETEIFIDPISTEKIVK